MEIATHTPGPWIVEDSAIMAREGNLGIARIHGLAGLAGTDDEYSQLERITEANARLIAAAPELLEALEIIFLATGPRDIAKGYDTPEVSLKAIRERARVALKTADGVNRD